MAYAQSTGESKQCPYCKRSYPILLVDGIRHLPGHAHNPNKLGSDACKGAGMKVKTK